ESIKIIRLHVTSGVWCVDGYKGLKKEVKMLLMNRLNAMVVVIFGIGKENDGAGLDFYDFS
ncbi:hypothetical protein QVL69_06700, partial [Bartonella henselae]|nr:hypothetical protein [Bartonella henselae]